MSANGNTPAMPVECFWPDKGNPYGIQTGNQMGFATGLTKRELFAAMAMQGLCADGSLMSHQRAQYAVEHADDLLAALESKPLTESQQAREANERG